MREFSPDSRVASRRRGARPVPAGSVNCVRIEKKNLRIFALSALGLVGVE